jgi:pyrroloquinoline quinone biosynthesis protein E
MPEPCRTCEHRAEDFGGCRCQAFLLTGDAEATDPACSLAPKHSLVESAVRECNAGTSGKRATGGSSFVQLQQQNAALWIYRTNPE